jgi:hypothetical protein
VHRLHISCQEAQGRPSDSSASTRSGLGPIPRATRGKKHQIPAPFNLTSSITAILCPARPHAQPLHRYVPLCSPVRCRPVQPAQRCCRAFTARLPFSRGRRGQRGCQSGAAWARLLSLPLPAPASAPAASSPTDAPSSPPSALTCTRPVPTLDARPDHSTATADPFVDPHQHLRTARLTASPRFPLVRPSRLLSAAPRSHATHPLQPWSWTRY